MSKTLVLYVFHDYNDRVKHFIEHCIFKDDHVDFIMIVNNENKTLVLPGYVKILFRKNKGHDFGGWSDALLRDDLYKKYDNFIFVNSTAIGPFLPSYYQGKWTDIYINGLQENVKLFGSTINTLKDPLNKAHVQSYIFSMDRTALDYLIECKIFSTTYVKTRHDAIWKKEVAMSRRIIEKKWNIGSLLSCYKDVDFTFTTKKPSDYENDFLDDVMFSEFQKKLWNVYDLVFVKGNRIKVE